MLSSDGHGGGEESGGREMLIANIFAQRLFGVNTFTTPTSPYFKMSLVASLVDGLPLSPSNRVQFLSPQAPQLLARLSL